MSSSQPCCNTGAGTRTATKIGVIVALAAAVGAAFYVKGQGAKSEAAPRAQAPEASQPAAAPKAESPTPLPRLVDLGAGKCIPCKKMAPILEELKKEYAGKLDVVFIDVWQNKGAGESFGIRTIPTQIFFEATGKELFRHEGFYSKEDILAKWKEFGVDLLAASSTAPAPRTVGRE